MSGLKIQHIWTLAYLLSKGARRNFVTVTTSEIGKYIQKSQQAASKHLTELESGQFIDRTISGRNISVRLTEKGYTEMLRLSATLQKCLNLSPRGLEIEGELVSGMNEGAYYMSHRGYTEQFESRIGYVPFPGTLNLRLDKKPDQHAASLLKGLEGIRIDGFSDGQRTFGWVKVFKCVVNDSIDCGLIVLERTHHNDTIVELISKVCIREAIGLNDGDAVSVMIPLDSYK